MRLLVILVSVLLVAAISFVAGIQVGRNLQNPRRRDEPPRPTSAVG